MASNFRVYVRNKENYPVALTYDQMDVACYAGLKARIWAVIKNKYQPIGKVIPTHKYNKYPSNQKIVDLTAPDKPLSGVFQQVPLDKQLVRVFFKKEYFGDEVLDIYNGCRNRKPLPLADDELSVGGYINPRFVGKFFKDTLRMIPEFNGCIGPDDDPLRIDLLLNRKRLRQIFLLLWITRRLDEQVNGFIVPNLIITARSLASIAPGLAYYYLLSLEAAWLGRVIDPIIRNGYVPKPVGDLNKNRGAEWSWNINHEQDLKDRNNPYMGHSLCSFVPYNMVYGDECAPRLKDITRIIKAGKLPRTVGNRDLWRQIANAEVTADYAQNDLVNSITVHKANPRTPSGYKFTRSNIKMVHIGLFPDQVELAYQEINEFGCVRNPEILDQLNNVVQFFARRPINYFIKGWKADE